MARPSKRTHRKIDPRNTAAKVRTVPCVAHASRARAGVARSTARKTPRIAIAGAWLRAAGFVPDKPCLVRAIARRQLIDYQPD